MRVVVVGAGRLGATLATALTAAGHATTLLVRDAARHAALRRDARWDDVTLVSDLAASPPGDVDIWTLPDRALPDAPLRDAAAAPVALHAAGSLTAEILRPIDGVARGVLHPLAACPDPLTVSGGAPLNGATFGISGAAAAVTVAERLARDLGGHPLALPPGAQTAYHAAAALTANDLVALLLAAEHVGVHAGLQASTLRRGLVHLARTALDALDRVPDDRPWVDGLTGAVARGDDATLRAHLDVLEPKGRALHAAASVGLTHAAAASNRLTPEAVARLLAALTDRQ